MTAPTPRFFDFDAAMEEAQADGSAPPPLTIRLFGKVWTLPADPPAREMLIRKRGVAALRRFEMARVKALAEGRTLTEGEAQAILADLGPAAEEIYTRDVTDPAAARVGADNLAAWLNEGLGYQRLNDIITWVETQHDRRYAGPAADDEAEEGDARPPAQGPAPAPESDGPGTTSSPDGPSSKPTSTGSTGSTSSQPSPEVSPGDG